MKTFTLLITLTFNISLFCQGSSDLALVGSGPRSSTESLLDFNLSKLNGSFQFIDNNLLKKTENSNIKGSFYLYKNWKNKSSIITRNNKKYDLPNINFDLDIEKFISKTSKDSVFIYTDLKEIKISDNKFIKIENKYFEILIDKPSKISFFKNYSGKLKKAVLNKMTNQQLRPAEYVKLIKYFTLKNNQLSEVKLSKKNILKTIDPKNQKEIKKYIKDNKLSYKKEKDVLKILIHNNKLTN